MNKKDDIQKCLKGIKDENYDSIITSTQCDMRSKILPFNICTLIFVEMIFDLPNKIK